MVDLEPHIPSRREGLTISAAVSHPYDHGADCMGPGIVPVCDDLRASSNGSGQGGNGTIGVASHGCESGILNRVIAVPFALNGGLACRRIVWNEALMHCAANVVGEDTTVGNSGGGERHNRGDCGELHSEGMDFWVMSELLRSVWRGKETVHWVRRPLLYYSAASLHSIPSSGITFKSGRDASEHCTSGNKSTCKYRNLKI